MIGYRVTLLYDAGKYPKTSVFRYDSEWHCSRLNLVFWAFPNLKQASRWNRNPKRHWKIDLSINPFNSIGLFKELTESDGCSLLTYRGNPGKDRNSTIYYVTEYYKCAMTSANFNCQKVLPYVTILPNFVIRCLIFTFTIFVFMCIHVGGAMSMLVAHWVLLTIFF